MTQEIITQITDTVGTEVFGIWFLIGAAFVFFMIMLPAFFALVNPVSTIANPACIKEYNAAPDQEPVPDTSCS